MEIGPVPVMYKFKMTTTVDRVEKSSFNQYMDAAMVISLTLHKVLIHTAAEAGYIEWNISNFSSVHENSAPKHTIIDSSPNCHFSYDAMIFG